MPNQIYIPKLNQVLIWLMQKLYPPGRAWFMPPPIQTGEYIQDTDGIDIQDTDGNFLVTSDYTVKGGWFYRLHRALSIQFGIAWNAARSVQNSQLPDNPYFSIDDAHDWYRRFGIFDSGLVSLTDMKAAIRQRMSFPGSPLNQQSATFITQQLQLAGFNVTVYENRFFPGPVTKTPEDILGTPVLESFLGGFYLGDSELGSASLLDNVSLIADYLEDEQDAGITITNYRSTFYIADPAGITTFATIPAARHVEFRQLLMKLKSKHTIGILFILYI